MGAGGSAGTQLARHEHPEGAKSLQKPTHESEGAVGEADGRGVARVGDLVGATLGDLVGVAGLSVGLTGDSIGRMGSTGTSSGLSLRMRRPAARAGIAVCEPKIAKAAATAAAPAASGARRRVADGRLIFAHPSSRAVRACVCESQRRTPPARVSRGGRSPARVSPRLAWIPA